MIHLKYFQRDRKTNKSLKLLISIFDVIYRIWELFQQIFFAQGLFASNYDKYQMLSLMLHVLFLFLRTILFRIYGRSEYQLDETQFGFHSGLCNHDSLNVNAIACFIDIYREFHKMEKHIVA